MEPQRLSKYLSLILRHQPQVGHIVLDEAGWTDLDTLVANVPQGGGTRADVVRVVASNDKQRFTIDGDKIRANQGHSVPVNLNLEALEPPEFLYHGTNHAAFQFIKAQGLNKGTRHHVHMSAESGTAVAVGRRTGAPVLCQVAAKQMHQDGHIFYRSANGVWLTDHVPPQYLTVEL
jgi:putative RNA 2'-phosphotransferase